MFFGSPEHLTFLRYKVLSPHRRYRDLWILGARVTEISFMCKAISPSWPGCIWKPRVGRKSSAHNIAECGTKSHKIPPSMSLLLLIQEKWKLKGKFFQTTMWIGWVESNFTNPTVKVWADLDNPFKRSDYAKLCMSPSLDGTLPEYMISQEDNSPLTLYIDFHNC